MEIIGITPDVRNIFNMSNVVVFYVTRGDEANYKKFQLGKVAKAGVQISFSGKIEEDINGVSFQNGYKAKIVIKLLQFKQVETMECLINQLGTFVFDGNEGGSASSLFVFDVFPVISEAKCDIGIDGESSVTFVATRDVISISNVFYFKRNIDNSFPNNLGSRYY